MVLLPTHVRYATNIYLFLLQMLSVCDIFVYLCFRTFILSRNLNIIMRLKPLAVVASLAMATVLNAESLYLHIQTNDGDWHVYDIAQVDRLTFADGNMTATDANSQPIATFTAGNLTRMQVNDSRTDITEYPVPAGIATVTTDATATFAINGHNILALADGAFTITTIDGRSAVAIPTVLEGQSIDVSALASGTYIITLGTYTQKVIIR
jgi:hypothetical protein